MKRFRVQSSWFIAVMALVIASAAFGQYTGATNAPFKGPLGSAALPSFSWVSDPDTGFFRYGSNQIGWSTNGIPRGIFSSTGITLLNGGKLPASQVGPRGQTIIVAKSGGDYTTIGDALTYAATLTPAADNRITILVSPGTYARQLTMVDYVDVVGLDRKGCKITHTGRPAIIMASYASISNMTVAAQNTTGSTGALLEDPAAGGITDFTAENCDLLSVTWIIRCNGTLASNNTTVRNCYCEAGNPFFPDHGDGHRFIYNTCYFYGSTGLACHAPADMGTAATNSVCAYNTFDLTYLTADQAGSYAFDAKGNGNRFHDNIVRMVTARQLVIGFYMERATGTTPGTNYAYNNIIELHTTHATPRAANIWTQSTTGGFGFSDLVATGNSITLTADNAWDWKYAVYNQGSAFDPGDIAWMMSETLQALTVDYQTLGGAPTPTTVVPKQITVQYVYPAEKKRPTVQAARDVTPTDDDGVVAAFDFETNLLADWGAIDLSAVTLDVPRCLRYVPGTATAGSIVEVVGQDYSGQSLVETITFADPPVPINGTKPFATLWTCYAKAGTGTATIGWCDVLGLKGVIDADADVTAVAIGAGSATRPLLTAPGTVDATNMTVDCSTLNVGGTDDVEIYFEGY